MVQHHHHIQISQSESIAQHPLATILIKKLFHIFDEIVELALELILILLRHIWVKLEVDCICS